MGCRLSPSIFQSWSRWHEGCASGLAQSTVARSVCGGVRKASLASLMSWRTAALESELPMCCEGVICVERLAELRVCREDLDLGSFSSSRAGEWRLAWLELSSQRRYHRVPNCPPRYRKSWHSARSFPLSRRAASLFSCRSPSDRLDWPSSVVLNLFLA